MRYLSYWLSGAVFIWNPYSMNRLSNLENLCRPRDLFQATGRGVTIAADRPLAAPDSPGCRFLRRKSPVPLSRL
jgi:hypothetical protein